MTEEMGFQMFPANRRSAPEGSTVGQYIATGKARSPMVERRVGYVRIGQQAMMSMQSGDTDKPRQQMSEMTNGVPHQGTAELSGV